MLCYWRVIEAHSLWHCCLPHSFRLCVIVACDVHCAHRATRPLHKQSWNPLEGWTRRWFVLPLVSSGAGRTTSDELVFYDSPSSSTVRGRVRIRGADIFVPQSAQGLPSRIKPGSFYASRCFCIMTQSTSDQGRLSTSSTLLAAFTIEDRDRWVSSLSSAAQTGTMDARVSGTRGSAVTAMSRRSSMMTLVRDRVRTDSGKASEARRESESAASPPNEV